MNPQPLVLETSALPIELRPFVCPPTYRIRASARCAPCDCGPLKANEVRVYVVLGAPSNRKRPWEGWPTKDRPKITGRRTQDPLAVARIRTVVQLMFSP